RRAAGGAHAVPVVVRTPRSHGAAVTRPVPPPDVNRPWLRGELWATSVRGRLPTAGGTARSMPNLEAWTWTRRSPQRLRSPVCSPVSSPCWRSAGASANSAAPREARCTPNRCCRAAWTPCCPCCAPPPSCSTRRTRWSRPAPPRTPWGWCGAGSWPWNRCCGWPATPGATARYARSSWTCPGAVRGAVRRSRSPRGAWRGRRPVEDLTEARRIEAVRRDFVANVSHELKTPVGALSLLSEAVMDASDDPEAVERFAGRMQIEATRLTSLVQELIDLSRVQNDDPLDDAEPVRVSELVAEAIERCRHAAGTKEITMATNVGGREGSGEAGDGAAADGADDLRVWGNRGQLAAALGTVVENAVNYSPVRTRVGRAARSVARTGAPPVGTAVPDPGIGIPEKDKERVFERFYRVDPARSRATGGTGLGLSIVKHVAASHGGDVTVWSAEGQGSTFTLRLPQAPAGRDRASR